MNYALSYTLLTVTLLLAAAGLATPQLALVGAARSTVEQIQASTAAEALHAAVCDASLTARLYGSGRVELSLNALVKLEPGLIAARHGAGLSTLKPPPDVTLEGSDWLTGVVTVNARMDGGTVRVWLEA